MTALLIASIIALTNQFGSVSVDTFGARVASYVPNGGREVLVTLPSGVGGIPLCWPWFKYGGPKGEASPKHGLARYRDFTIVERANGLDVSRVVLRLDSDDESRKLWPHDFSLVVTVVLDADGLTIEMSGTNTGTSRFEVFGAFHPYVRRDVGGEIDDSGSGAFRLWDPDAASHTKTQGLTAGDWKMFVCPESGIFTPQDSVVVNPGECHTMSRTLSPRPRVLDKRPLQRRVDAVSALGGGFVRVTSGDWTVASLELKNGVTLRLEEGTRILASTNYADYANTPGENRGAVICANGAKGVAVVGPGIVDGRGGDMPRITKRPGRWRGLVFTGCSDVRIEDVSIRDAHTWGCYLKECDGVVVKNVKIVNHANQNNDGLDIASRNVLVEGCDIDSEDDGLVFKNSNPDFVVENVTVRDCRISSNSGFVKIGTESYGGFRNICVSNCTLDARRPVSIRADYSDRPGVRTLHTGQTGLSVLVVDGGFVEGVRFSDIEMRRGILVPICIRLDRRHDSARGNKSHLQDVVIERVNMKCPTTSWMASTITGSAGLRPKGIRIRDAVLRLSECPSKADAGLPVLEKQGGYPGGMMFQVATPAYGFFVRHADDVRLENVELLSGGGDVRRPVVAVDADLRDDKSGRVFAGDAVESVSLPKRKESLVGNPKWDARFTTIRSSCDGSVVPFYWYDPGLTNAVPLIVVFHSWSANCFWASPARNVASFCEKNGWAMAYPDFRGANNVPEACGSDLAVQDVMDVIAWVKKMRKVDDRRVYLIGGSGGGHMTLLMAGRHPEVFAGAAAFCPITDLARWHGESLRRVKRYAKNLESVCGGTPTTCRSEYDRRSPMAYLAHPEVRSVPIYIATGIHDGHAGSVPVGHAIRAFNSLADERHVIDDSTIAFIEDKEQAPESLRYQGDDPFYGKDAFVHLRVTSGNVRLTLFEGGHAGNYPAGLDFLSRQRRGERADMFLPESASSVIENVTK